MCNVHAIRKYGVGLSVSFLGYSSTPMSEHGEFHTSCLISHFNTFLPIFFITTNLTLQ